MSAYRGEHSKREPELIQNFPFWKSLALADQETALVIERIASISTAGLFPQHFRRHATKVEMMLSLPIYIYISTLLKTKEYLKLKRTSYRNIFQNTKMYLEGQFYFHNFMNLYEIFSTNDVRKVNFSHIFGMFWIFLTVYWQVCEWGVRATGKFEDIGNSWGYLATPCQTLSSFFKAHILYPSQYWFSRPSTKNYQSNREEDCKRAIFNLSKRFLVAFLQHVHFNQVCITGEILNSYRSKEKLTISITALTLLRCKLCIFWNLDTMWYLLWKVMTLKHISEGSKTMDGEKRCLFNLICAKLSKRQKWRERKTMWRKRCLFNLICAKLFADFTKDKDKRQKTKDKKETKVEGAQNYVVKKVPFQHWP